MLPLSETVLRLIAAAAAGSVIGLERERRMWAAGLRTHMLVCVGSCLIMIVSAYGFTNILKSEHVILDPSRIAAQVVSGIGFLGAGTILLRGEIVRGLTTAASLWAVAAIGLAIGSGLYMAAVATTVIVLVILAGIKPIEDYYRQRLQSREMRFFAKQGAISLNSLQATLGERSTRVRQFVVQPSDTDGLDEVSITFLRLPQEAVDDIKRKLRSHPGVVRIEDDVVADSG